MLNMHCIEVGHKKMNFFFNIEHRRKEMAALCIRYNDRESKSKAHKIESICCQSSRENNDQFSCYCIFL